MSPKRTLILGFIFLLLVITLDSIAYRYHIYWRIWWSDWPMHFLGGITVGLLATYLAFFFKKDRKYPSTGRVWLVVIISVLIVGATWEMFEFKAGRLDASKIKLRSIYRIESIWVDSTGDILFDILGASFIATILVSLNKKNINVQKS